MKLAFGCDNCAQALKKELMASATELGHECVDCGAFEGEANHYPIFSARAAKMVAEGKADRGVVVCGTGVGVSLAANKIHGIRCALCGDCYTAKYTRLHNDSNMLALGARVIGPELAKMILEIFLTTDFEGGRHQTRVDMISALERGEEIE